MKHRPDPTGVSMVALAAAGFGLGGPLARAAGEIGFNGTTFAFWRSAGSVVALVVLLAIGVAIGRLPAVPLRSINRVEWLQLLAMGLFVAGTTLGLFLGYERSTIALTLIVFYTYPVIVALAAVRIYAEPLGPQRLAAILLASFGMVLVVLGPGATDGDGVDLLGVLFAFGAAACQTGYALVASRGFASVPTFQAATLLRGFSLLAYVIVLVPLILLIGEADRLIGPLDSIDAWVIIFIAGVFSAALPTAGLVAGYRRVGPTRGAVLMLLEPVTGVLLAALLLAEQPAPIQLFGGLLVLAGAVLVQVTPSRHGHAETEPLAE
ncbi:MAG: DMT family transporter [Chloroflexota bacterium]|nr:DMT family transporter [Chloroflexota bacterium]